MPLNKNISPLPTNHNVYKSTAIILKTNDHNTNCGLKTYYIKQLSLLLLLFFRSHFYSNFLLHHCRCSPYTSLFPTNFILATCGNVKYILILHQKHRLSVLEQRIENQQTILNIPFYCDTTKRLAHICLHFLYQFYLEEKICCPIFPV